MSTVRKKVYEVVKASKKMSDIDGLEVDGRHYAFGPSGAMVVKDKGVADAIEERFGGHSKTGSRDVVVCEVDNAGSHYPRKVFSIRAPWKDEE